MSRGVRWYLVGSLVLVTLAGCSRLWFAQREPWRREAEIACLKSGAVKEGPAVRLMRPIEGPGICGADYPLKVAALGEESPPLAYDDEPLRPPGAIPGSLSRYPPAIAAAGNPPGAAPYTPMPAPGAPLVLAPPGQRSAYEPPPAYGMNPASSAAAGGVPLGPAHGGIASAIPANVTPPATLACPLVSALDRWVSESVQPAAVRWFGAQVVEIKQISAYSCRGMNGQPGAHISEHAFGNALDIAAFTLADGRRITVQDGWRGPPEEQGFLHDVQLAACEQFSTVLAPGSNVYHYNHIHVDLMRRASGRRICEPRAVPGDVVAARVRARYGSRDASITGSIPRGSSHARASSRPAWDREDGGRPPAVPGQD
ncbi:MAG TPA: extensin family protein [Xanthobacteraceae bacterium]|nr:extensin family protein [Xanthobacteraceae bacterium]